MKKVLIGLYGLPRTFKSTSSNLFEKIITPNKDKYEFDIYINTDFLGKGLTAGRPDTNATGYSVYNYDNIELLRNDLLKHYNMNNQVVDISIWNFDKEFCNPWFLDLKRTENILVKAYELGKTYDYYCILRMDTIVDTSINIDIIDNKLVFITNILTRPGFFHNRDMFNNIIGANTPFIKFIQFFLNISNNIVKKREEFIDFFSLKKFHDIDYLSIYKEITIKDINIHINNVVKELKLYHSSNNVTDMYLSKNTTIPVNMFEYFNHTSSQFYIDMLILFDIILNEHKIVLSENLYPSINFRIIR